MTARETVRTRVVGAALLDDADRPTRMLVARRAYPAALRGLWEFPGGKQEPGETARDALVRECREELGVLVRPHRELAGPTAHGWPLHESAALRVFTATTETSEFTATPKTTETSEITETTEITERTVGPAVPRAGADHLEVRWMDLDRPERITALDWIPADRPVVDALLDSLRSGHLTGGSGRVPGAETGVATEARTSARSRPTAEHAHRTGPAGIP